MKCCLVLVLAGLILSLCCGAMAGLGGRYALGILHPETPGGLATVEGDSPRPPSATPTPTVPRATATRAAPTPPRTPTPTATAVPSPLSSLEPVGLPHRDLADLASRLLYGGTPIPQAVSESPREWTVGDVDTFWIANTDTHKHVQIRAVLRVQTDHVQMWVEEGASVDLDGLRRSAERFEQQTYPTNRRLFGSEWTPGVDGDPRLVILHARKLGGVGGYFSAADEYSRLANPFSNEREMFYINLDYRTPGTEGYDSTLAHEFQHMIHWHQDRNEDAWVNEGLSMLAQHLNNLPVGNLHEVYLRQPDLQLTTWGDENNGPHYGASYLLMAYFLERYGEQALRLLVEADGDGVEGFDQVLPKVGGADFEAFFADWVMANLLDNPRLSDGRYGYALLQLPTPQVERVRGTPFQPYAGTVSQYSVDYLELPREGLGLLRFEGDETARLVPTSPHSGRFAWWSNRGDDVNPRLTRAFDLSVLGQATLEVWMWYDLEQDYDYAYASVSTDGGRSWTLLKGQYTTEENPTGNNLRYGWNGLSGVPEGSTGNPTWVQEKLNLSPFTGGRVWVRFEVVTDDAVNHPGLLLDDICIPELGFCDDAETGEAGWQAEGFIRVDNVVPQRWVLQAVAETAREAQVVRIPVAPDGRATWRPGRLPPATQRVVLALSALAPSTTEVARYRLWLEPLGAETQGGQPATLP